MTTTTHSPDRAPLDRARELPCWRGDVSPVALAGGLSNHNFTVTDGGEKFVARIGGDMPMHNVMRFNEHACARAAATVGIAPTQVYTADDAQVLAYVDGAGFDAVAVRKNLSRIITQLKICHNDATRELRGAVLAFSVFHVLRHYHKLLANDACRCAAQLPELMSHAQALEVAAGASKITLCHNDLLPANFIDDGAKIWLIDWEHAGFGFALFDLANLAANSEFPDELEREMLAIYYENNAIDSALWRSYKALRAASHLREAMWSMTAEIHSDLDEDYAAYTDKNLSDFRVAYKKFLAL